MLPSSARRIYSTRPWSLSAEVISWRWSTLRLWVCTILRTSLRKSTKNPTKRWRRDLLRRFWDRKRLGNSPIQKWKTNLLQSGWRIPFRNKNWQPIKTKINKKRSMWPQTSKTQRKNWRLKDKILLLSWQSKPLWRKRRQTYSNLTQKTTTSSSEQSVCMEQIVKPPFTKWLRSSLENELLFRNRIGPLSHRLFGGCKNKTFVCRLLIFPFQTSHQLFMKFTSTIWRRMLLTKNLGTQCSLFWHNSVERRT